MKKVTVFQFSIELTGDLTPLLSWLSHFEKTGMASGIVEHEGKFSVWRAGDRKGGNLGTFDEPKGVLRMHRNGFYAIWLANFGQVPSEDTRAVGYDK